MVNDDSGVDNDELPDSPFVREWIEQLDGKNAMLTDTDRRFLAGVKTYENKVTRSARRRSIRDRVLRSLYDLKFLQMLEDNQREKIFADIEENDEFGNLREAISSFVAFLYLGLDGDIPWLKSAIERGVAQGEQERLDDDTTYYTHLGLDVRADVDIEITQGFDVDEIEDRFRSGHGHTLTPAEVGVLVREGRVDPGELAALDNTVRDRLNPKTGELEDPGSDPIMGGEKPSTLTDEENGKGEE